MDHSSHKLNNVVIEVLNDKHAKKVKKFFNANGIDTAGLEFGSTKDKYPDSCFYGIVNGRFFVYYYFQLINVKILTLEQAKALVQESDYPKVMLVSHDGERWSERVVIIQKNRKFIAWNNAQTLDQAEKVTSTTDWNYAKDLPTAYTLEDAKEALAEKHNLSVDKIEIK